MTKAYVKRKVYPVRICPGCGKQYQKNGRTCGDPRCASWVSRHPGELRGPLKVFIKPGHYMPESLRQVLGDEALITLWNKGTENRVAVKEKAERDSRLPGADLPVPAAANPAGIR